ncbi:MAG: alkaline phosphatase family protein [Desulfurococcales archaeon]|nr:alkaline phosphatase family protein [Desulfurococcales archaeon]
MAKLLYIVLDGAADGFDPERSSLRRANTPGLDALARNALCTLVYTVRKGIAPESDVAVMSLLGYDPEKYYTGRGPLEALGAGIPVKRGDLALRANFATVDPRTLRIIDRRAGRSVTSEEAAKLAESLDGMALDGGKARAVFRATIGHRAVLVIRHSEMELDARISNTDPAYERVGLISHARREYEPYIQKAVPLVDTPGARKAAELVNEFTVKAIEILDKHPVNEERRRRGLLPANAVLLRDAGDRPPEAPPFAELYGFSMASIVEMVVERGIARALGLRDIPVRVEGRPREELLREEAEKAVEALQSHGGVYVHLKGPDEPGHDGDFDSKVEAIEQIDSHFISYVLDNVDRENTIIVVTSDHATPWYLKAHSDDPVPLMISHPALKGPGAFDEVTCRDNMSLPILDRGYKIVPTVIDVSRSLGLPIG